MTARVRPNINPLYVVTHSFPGKCNAHPRNSSTIPNEAASAIAISLRIHKDAHTVGLQIQDCFKRTYKPIVLLRSMMTPRPDHPLSLFTPLRNPTKKVKIGLTSTLAALRIDGT